MVAKLWWKQIHQQMAKPEEVLLTICMRETKEGELFFSVDTLLGIWSRGGWPKPCGCAKKEAYLTSYDVCCIISVNHLRRLSYLSTLSFLPFGCPAVYGVQGWGSDVSLSCELHCSDSNTRFWTPRARLGIKPVSQRCKETASPLWQSHWSTAETALSMFSDPNY